MRAKRQEHPISLVCLLGSHLISALEQRLALDAEEQQATPACGSCCNILYTASILCVTSGAGPRGKSWLVTTSHERI